MNLGKIANWTTRLAEGGHYGLTYSAPELMPGWAALEELTMGALSHLYAGLAKDADRKAIARRMDLPCHCCSRGSTH
ncbi:Abi family protein [Marinobacter sp. M3C]|uniref:Abi family protein n=1 Tax=Marinobacter sp. M3C TaxID=2917715 RepID=UPI0032C498F8